MNKKIVLFTLLFMLFSVSFVSAQRMCKSDDVLEVLRKALYIYYTNPKASSFTPEELKDLLGFYVGIQSGQITVDCTAQSDNIDKANALPDTIPSCSDGTKYGKCSATKPMYCYAGRLVPRCRLCGCPIGQWCDITYVDTSKGNKGQWGKCNPGTNITCTVNADCGISGYVGNYSCINLDVYRNYTKYVCLNPGGTNSSCKNETIPVLIDDCQATEQCVEGQAECQTIPVTGAITNCQGLQNMKNDLAGNYYLANDIDCSDTKNWNNSQGFEPVGNYDNSFEGAFDGKGYKITGLYINRPDTDFIGLFGSAVNSKIENVGIEQASMIGGTMVGGLVGLNTGGTITNSHSTGGIKGVSAIGGLVGYNTENSIITNSYSTVSVTITGGGAGGLVGTNFMGSTITNSYSEGDVNGNSNIGGLSGENSYNSIISYSYSTGNVKGTGTVGGLVGQNYEGSTVSNSYSTGIVSGNYVLGGLVGDNAQHSKGSTVSNSYSTGSVSGENVLGGLVGNNYAGSTVSNSYSTRSVNGTKNIGGLIGVNSGSVMNSRAAGSVNGVNSVGGLVGQHSAGLISDSYSIANVNGYMVTGGLIGLLVRGSATRTYSAGKVEGSFYAECLVGQIQGDGTITDSYCDTQTSGQTTSSGGTGKTTAEMKQKTTFSGWDFANTWGICEGTTYPWLKWENKICLSSEPYVQAWSKSFPWTTLEDVRELIVDNNDKLYFIGTLHPTSGTNDWKIIKFDPYSQIEIGNYKKSWGTDDDPDDALIASDGSLVVAGTANIKLFDRTLIKFDGSLNPLWTYINSSYDKDDRFLGVVEVDSVVVSSGTANLFTGGRFSGVLNYLEGRSLSNGDKIWGKEFDFDNYGFNKIIRGGEALYVLATKDTYFVSNPDTRIFKFDLNGNLRKDWTVGGSGTDQGYSLISTSDGGFAFIGTTTSSGAGSYDIWVVKYDSLDNMEWSKTFGSSGQDSSSNVIEIKNNPSIKGFFAIAGTYSDKDAWLILIDQEGNKVWDKTFELGENEYGKAIAEDSSGNLYFSLSKNTPGNWHSNEIITYQFSPQ